MSKEYSNQKKIFADDCQQFLSKSDWMHQYLKQSSKLLAIRQRIQKLQKIKDELKEKAKISKNIKQYKQGCKSVFQQYLKLIDFDNFKQAIAKPKGVVYYLIVGNISAGKSSFINYYFDTKQSVGVGETTSKPRLVTNFINKKGETVYLWDTPGKNEQFNILSVDMLKYFASADKVFLLSQNGIGSILQLATVIEKLHSNSLFCIRTKCDGWKSTHKYTLEQQRNRDKANLLLNGILCRAYYQVGSLKEKNQTNILQFDNKKVQNELKN